MSITLKDLKAIKSDLAKRKPPKPVLDVNRDLTTKEVIMALAPDLITLKSKGFSTQDLVDILKEHKISIKGATLNRYLAEHKATPANETNDLLNAASNKISGQALHKTPPKISADLV